VLVIVDLPSASGPPRPICGDGVVVAPEECDDGNRINGDCCDSNCHFESVGTVCGNPGDPCLESLCDGAGTCDVEGRSCRRPVAPEASQLSLKHGRQDRLTWKWWTGVSSQADFGDPLGATAYDLCVLDKGTGAARLLLHASLAPGESCGAAPCWTQTPAGFEYRHPGGPLQQLTLKGGLPGRARITARSAGGALTLPSLPLAPPVLVRLRARGGLCWAANFSVPERNTRRRFASAGDGYYP
jgi:cysteine-rich repeat protein